jgi:integrase
MFSLAVRWEMRPDNPVNGLERNHEDKRARYLSGDELRRLIQVLAVYKNRDAANVIRLLLLTGARRGEVLAATWDQFDLEAGVWTKPSSHTKQRREHRVPLSGPARRLLSEMKRAAERRAAEANRQYSPFLFPAQRRRWRGERDTASADHMREVKGQWATICRLADLRGVRVHDLRHTYASVLASAGQSLPVIGALLGHTQPATTARYSHLFDDPLRAATEQMASAVGSPAGDRIAQLKEDSLAEGEANPSFDSKH